MIIISSLNSWVVEKTNKVQYRKLYLVNTNQ